MCLTSCSSDLWEAWPLLGCQMPGRGGGGSRHCLLLVSARPRGCEEQGGTVTGRVSAAATTRPSGQHFAPKGSGLSARAASCVGVRRTGEAAGFQAGAGKSAHFRSTQNRPGLQSQPGHGPGDWQDSPDLAPLSVCGCPRGSEAASSQAPVAPWASRSCPSFPIG